MAKQVFLVRHGETAWSLSGKHTGLTDIPLTENGKKQALSLAPLLKQVPFEKAFVSPLKRAQETFSLLDLSNQATLDHDLVEWDYGDYEGKTSAEIAKEDPNWFLFENGAPHGESLAAIEKRASQVLDKIKACSENVLIISSGHFLRALAVKWLGFPVSMGRHLVLSTGSLSILGFEHNKPVLTLWNGRNPLL